MKYSATSLLAAVLAAGGAFLAPPAGAEDRVCIRAEGGVVVRMRVRSKSYTGGWSKNIPSPRTHCLDVRKVPVGECYRVEIDPKLWRRSNYSCAHKAKERTGRHGNKQVHWNISTTLWGNRCNASRYGNGRYYAYDIYSGVDTIQNPSLFHDREVALKITGNQNIRNFYWDDRKYNKCMPR